MRRHRTRRDVLLPSIMLLCLASEWDAAGSFMVRAAEPSATTLQEQGDGLMKNVEEMLAHGGMGDANAIVHHCGEATHHAEALVKQLTASDPPRDDVVAHLKEVIRQCNRVSEIGRYADPGLLLNPAIKARTAARESMRSLGLLPKRS